MKKSKEKLNGKINIRVKFTVKKAGSDKKTAFFLFFLKTLQERAIGMSYLNDKNVLGAGMPFTWRDVFQGHSGPRKKSVTGSWIFHDSVSFLSLSVL